MGSSLVTNEEGKKINVIDSREVAEMMGKEHKEILQYLEGLKDKNGKVKVVGIIPTLEQSGDLHVANYFIESTYDDRGRTMKCYLVTKMGCELLGNKQQGAKGILFSATYVKRFNEMEQTLQNQQQPKLPTTFKEALLMLIEAEEEKEKLLLENEGLSLEKRLLSGEVFSWAKRPLINALVRAYAKGDFGRAWTEYKKNLLYSHSININSRITNYLNKTGKKTKPKTLDMLDDSEIPNAIATIISMCNEEEIDITDIIKHYKDNDKNKLN